jgi:hypothetical protein
MADLKEIPKKPVHRQQSSGRGVIRIAQRTADLIDHPETVKDWDDEELHRGRRRDKNGKFTGRDPIVVPTDCYREMMRRQMRRAQMLLGENLEEAVKCLTEIIAHSKAEDKDKIKAAQLLIDRVMGRNPEQVEINVKQPLFLGILAGGIVPGPLREIEAKRDDSDIIDAVVVSDSDDLEWE